MVKATVSFDDTSLQTFAAACKRISFAFEGRRLKLVSTTDKAARAKTVFF